MPTIAFRRSTFFGTEGQTTNDSVRTEHLIDGEWRPLSVNRCKSAAVVFASAIFSAQYAQFIAELESYPSIWITRDLTTFSIVHDGPIFHVSQMTIEAVVHPDTAAAPHDTLQQVIDNIVRVVQACPVLQNLPQLVSNVEIKLIDKRGNLFAFGSSSFIGASAGYDQGYQNQTAGRVFASASQFQTSDSSRQQQQQQQQQQTASTASSTPEKRQEAINNGGDASRASPVDDTALSAAAAVVAAAVAAVSGESSSAAEQEAPRIIPSQPPAPPASNSMDSLPSNGSAANATNAPGQETTAATLFTPQREPLSASALETNDGNTVSRNIVFGSYSPQIISSPGVAVVAADSSFASISAAARAASLLAPAQDQSGATITSSSALVEENTVLSPPMFISRNGILEAVSTPYLPEGSLLRVISSATATATSSSTAAAPSSSSATNPSPQTNNAWLTTSSSSVVSTGSSSASATTSSSRIVSSGRSISPPRGTGQTFRVVSTTSPPRVVSTVSPACIISSSPPRIVSTSPRIISTASPRVVVSTVSPSRVVAASPPVIRYIVGDSPTTILSSSPRVRIVETTTLPVVSRPLLSSSSSSTTTTTVLSSESPRFVERHTVITSSPRYLSPPTYTSTTISSRPVSSPRRVVSPRSLLLKAE